MTPDLTGPMEARLLALERRQARIGDSLRTLKRQAIAAGQGIWDAWGEVTAPVVTGGGTTPTATRTIAGCPGQQIAATVYVRDPVYGAVTLAWDGTSMWTGCLVVHFFGFGGTCPEATSVAAHYDLLPTGHLRMRWISADPAGNKCPQASTPCAATPNVAATSTQSISVESCVPFRASILIGPQDADFIIYGNALNAGIRIDMSESPL